MVVVMAVDTIPLVTVAAVVAAEVLIMVDLVLETHQVFHPFKDMPVALVDPVVKPEEVVEKVLLVETLVLILLAEMVEHLQ